MTASNRSHLSICFWASLVSADVAPEVEAAVDVEAAVLCPDHCCSLRPAVWRPAPVIDAARSIAAFVALAAPWKLLWADEASAAGSILIDGAEAAESRFCS